MCKIFVAVLALCAVSRIAAHAQVFSDTDSTMISHRTDPVVLGTAPVTYFSQVGSDTTIIRISVYNQLVTAGDLKFLIFGSALITPLFNSGSQPFSEQAGLTWNSYTLTTPFTLLAGQTYYIGALADVPANYGSNSDGSYTQNGLTSAQANGTAENYNAPIQNGSGNGRIPIILYGNIVVAPEASPAASLGLLSFCLASIVLARKGRNSRT